MNPTNNHSEPAAPSRTATEACASATEVRNFLHHIKTRDLEEVLGTAQSHSLAGSIAQATVITLVLLVGFTIGPAVWSMLSPVEKSAVRAPEKEAKVETPEPSKTAAPPATSSVAAPATTKATGKTAAVPPAGKDFLDKIGANETKPANPKVNPLDKTTDDLFKDLDKK